jgi:general secretion pathway protein F
MTAYKYEALDAAGKSTAGIVEADTPKAARSQLRTQRLVPLAITPVVVAESGAKAGGLRSLSRKAFSASGLAIWTRQLAGLVAAGLPLERALTALADESEEQRQRDLISHLRSEVNGGATFARALGTVSREFDDVYRAVVAAGEQSGALGAVLERLADDLEERQSLKGKVLGAMLYPMIVSLIACVIVAFLVTYVVPQVATVFASSKHALPTLTVVMLAISGFARKWGLLVLVGIALAIALFNLLMRREGFRQRFDSAFLNVPLFGRLARGYNAARFAGTLSMLAGAGVPILKALQAAAETLSNHAMRADAMDALVQVREGAPLASAMAAHKRFPGLLAMFARLGEQTGQLPTMLDRAARQLANEVQRRAFALATLLEPLLIVAMGGVVMMIVLSVLLPIIQLNSFVK